MALNYIGSKISLLEFIEQGIKVVAPEARALADLFAGSGAVGEHFKKLGYTIVANDAQFYSYVINRHRIGNSQLLRFKNLSRVIPNLLTSSSVARPALVCQYLNRLPGKKGFIYNNYSAGGTKNAKYKRLYFSDANSQRCDAIRQTIERWKTDHLINEDEYYFLLCSLIESLDRQANTASIYGAYLKQMKPSARRNFILRPAPLTTSQRQHQVFNQDINELIKELSFEAVYLDPPYNHRQYSANYHLLETIAHYDNPVIVGKTGMRQGGYKSDYCSKLKVAAALTDLISNLQARYIFLSYNNEGLLSLADIKRIMSSRGQYGRPDPDLQTL